jgi:hypothetical protein
MRGIQHSHVQYDSVHSTHVADFDELTISFPRLLISSQDMLCHRQHNLRSSLVFGRLLIPRCYSTEVNRAH